MQPQPPAPRVNSARDTRPATRSFRALLVHPAFSSASFWNYRTTCELTGAKYPAIPLGLLTVAGMLPTEWDLRLVDCNAQPLTDEDILQADLVFSGGMISQQPNHLALIERVHRLGKQICVGGTDATSSPQLYDAADFLVLNEAEVMLPQFLQDYAEGAARHLYRTDELADVTTSPMPRYDLIDFDNYLHVGVQYMRGCPFNCEFCDIIVLFGQRPRVKTKGQILAELQCLYDLGYRGHVDFVDDNFIGNKKEAKALLPLLTEWLDAHDRPFEFSTEASINLAADDELLDLMQKANFSAIFVGIESPDEATLVAMQKKQNTKGSLVENIRKIYRAGIFVNAGFILGFDEEEGDVAQGLIDCIEATSIPVAMAGLLTALPNTQLTKRLAREGRLFDDYNMVQTDAADQCTGGLNFVSKRPRVDILNDYHRVIDTIYQPAAFFGRVRRMARQLNQSKKRTRLPLRYWLKDIRSFGRMLWHQGVRSNYRREFWKTLGYIATTNPKAFKYAVAVSALYAHFGPFNTYLTGETRKSIAREMARPGLSYEDVVGRVANKVKLEVARANA